MSREQEATAKDSWRPKQRKRWKLSAKKKKVILGKVILHLMWKVMSLS